MSARQEYRVRVFNPSEDQDTGLPTKTYAFVNSEEPDGAVAMSRGVPSARDSVIAGQRDHKADAVFCCPDDTPVRHNSVLRDLEDSQLYRVVGKSHARRREEFVLLCESASLDTDATVRITGEP